MKSPTESRTPLKPYSMGSSLLIIYLSFFFPSFYRHSWAYESSWAGGQIRAVAAGLCHSSTGSEPHLWPTYTAARGNAGSSRALCQVLNPLSHNFDHLISKRFYFDHFQIIFDWDWLIASPALFPKYWMFFSNLTENVFSLTLSKACLGSQKKRRQVTIWERKKLTTSYM